MVTLLIAIIVLQFAGANLGAHQLHAGNGAEEAENHPHLQFSAQVTTLAQCVDCVCPSEQALGFADSTGVASNHAGENQSSGFHSHLVKTTEIQDFDLCLDCQCHGGHVALLSQAVSQPVQALESVYLPTDVSYFPPENLPKYRPPIA
ncbi:hypothetical protein L5M38_19790 [Shewanella sp. SM101]|uniref:hypothetical protein n=1 Tax=Shewanella TaxID=22 RepID=UPI001564E72C|nr:MULTISPECIES: hypothetical protein [unclassified Shewanella]MCU8106762.1 hypothetical protein [Shewanella sp. SM101]NRD33867.1 hypothetical protein [Shewanella sp. DC2-4]